MNNPVQMALNFLDYTLIALYGFLLGTYLCGGFHNRREKRVLTIVFLLVMTVQSASALVFGLELTFKIYPLICHLPIVLLLHFSQKNSWTQSIVALLTAYFCCQIPRFFSKLGEWIFHTHTAYQIVYPLATIVTYYILKRYFCKTANKAMNYSHRSLLIFGSVPALYYLFDYLTTVYTSILYNGIKALSEFMPVVLAVFFVTFITLYHEETQKRNEAELQSSLMEMSVKQSEMEIATLMSIQEKNALYRHDMRHHLTMISGFISDGRLEEAQKYLRMVQEEMQQITPRRFCENNSVNVLFSAFSEKAERSGITMTIEVNVPNELAIPDMELCSLLSNALENAIHGTVEVIENREIKVSCRIKRDKLLISVENPYEGEITMAEGVPVSNRSGHGYGVKSIQSIVRRYRGICNFTTQGHQFLLRVVLPL